MATVVQSTVVGADPATLNTNFYQFLARDLVQEARAFGKGMLRIFATTTDAAAGAFVNLQTVVLSQLVTGFAFDTGTVRTIRVKAWGKSTTGNTNLQYIESVFYVVGNSTTPVAANSTGGTAFGIDVGTTGGAITCVVTSNQVTLVLAGKAATTLNWVLDVTVDDPVPLAA